MRRGIKLLLGSLAVSAAMVSGVQAAEKVIIGTFGDPTPTQMAAYNGEFAKATGWEVDWRKFASGTDVIAAMASGDIKVAELGSSPFAIRRLTIDEPSMCPASTSNAVTPGTTSKGTSAARRASISLPIRPKTPGSPLFR